jgi:hypothetical protein
MMRHNHLEHYFVEYIPEHLDSGVLYICMEYTTAAHRCCCGCGEEVVTPFSPTDWSITFDGETVSLSPSIGNWNFACRSHYFIRRGRVIEAGTWTDKKVEENRRMDRSAKARYYNLPNLTTPTLSTLDDIPEAKAREIVGIRKRIMLRWNEFAKKVTGWRKNS